MKITYSSSLSKHRLVKENNVKCYHQMKLLQAKVPKEGNNCYNLNLNKFIQATTSYEY
jgi:hypothetical protein